MLVDARALGCRQVTPSLAASHYLSHPLSPRPTISHTFKRALAVSITTTDLVSKSCALEVTVGGKTVTIGGMCKVRSRCSANASTDSSTCRGMFM